METTFIQRLELERDELIKKIDKLEAFTAGPKLQEVAEVQKPLLLIQLQAMKTYAACLHQRILDLNR